MLSDEGLDGLHLHAVNDRNAPIAASLRLAFLDGAGKTVAKAERPVNLPPHSASAWSSADLLGRFFDATVAYRFGPATHRLAHATLCDEAGAVIAESFHFPLGRDVEPTSLGLTAALREESGGWTLRVSTERPAFSVAIDLAGDGRPADNHFHLVPGFARDIPLATRRVVPGEPSRR